MISLRFLAGVGVCAVLAASSAQAADLSGPVVPAPMAPAPMVYNWNGLYAGVNGGFGGGTFSYPFTYSDPDPFVEGKLSAQASGFFGGGQIGYNFQMSPHWVAGVEADIDASGINDELSGSVSAPITGSVSGKTSVDWFGTVRGRLGYAEDRVLFYATGGFAYGSVKSGYNVDFGSPYVFGDSVTSSASGWAAGAGFEYKLTRHVSLKTEYLYVDLGKQTIYDDEILRNDNLNLKSDVAFHTIKVGLNVGF